MDDLVNDRYRLLELIGAGGMGRVYLADDELLDRRVAVKEVTGPGSPGAMREARAAARLDHPNVVRVYDVLWQAGRCWIVMEYVPSRSLHQAAPVSHREAARIALGVVAALKAAHRAGVLHGDVKPHNVLLAEDDRVMLTDFGLATVDSAGPDPTLGSPHYLAPERIRGEASGPPADLWSLGATLHAAVEGRSPFARPTPLGSMHAVLTEPPDAPAKRGPLTPIIERLLAKEPAARLTIAEVEPMLRRVADRTMGIFPVPIADGRRRLARSTQIAVTVSTMLLVATTGTALARDAVSDPPAVQTAPTTPAPPAICDDEVTAGSLVTPSGPARGYVPPGWVWHSDPLGFGLAVPQGWTSESDGEATCFRDPGSSRSLRVRTDAPITDQPLIEWRAQESAVLAAGTLPGYRLIGMATLDLKAGGADWEYSWQPTSGPRRHERLLLLRMSADRAYSLQWTTPDQEGSTDEPLLGLILSSLT
ncbi:serine/threonine-protein kinase [Actinoplanes sp. NPDC051633]|uniref:serine/threonine-protein kinase n=1 Tax=Actinoplanes sp. NPDC051633 TaxID=3155670 RepID=UPI00341905F2